MTYHARFAFRPWQVTFRPPFLRITADRVIFLKPFGHWLALKPGDWVFCESLN